MFQAANRDFFSQYLTEDVGSYVNRKRKHNVHGNHIEMQALSEMYNRPVEVFCYRSGMFTHESIMQLHCCICKMYTMWCSLHCRSHQHLSWHAQDR